MKVICINNTNMEKLFDLYKVYEVLSTFKTEPIYLLDVNDKGYWGDGQIARCIMFRRDYNKSPHISPQIISLEESFNHNGGLTKLSIFGAGLYDYKYRELNAYEVEDLIKNLRYDIDYSNNHNIDIKKILNDYLKTIRKKKLEKLNSCPQ
jgi:hypothetical protein